MCPRQGIVCFRLVQFSFVEETIFNWNAYKNIGQLVQTNTFGMRDLDENLKRWSFNNYLNETVLKLVNCELITNCLGAQP